MNLCHTEVIFYEVNVLKIKQNTELTLKPNGNMLLAMDQTDSN